MIMITPVPMTCGMTIGLLPGPNRKRTPRLYGFRVIYRNPDATEEGCLMTWEVLGGREKYQIALERLWTGGVKWHCTCADAIYKGSKNPYHVCKHVRAIQESLPALAA